MNKKLLVTALMAAAVFSQGMEILVPPTRSKRAPETEQERLARELAEVRGHQQRLKTAMEKRARKAAKRRALEAAA